MKTLGSSRYFWAKLFGPVEMSVREDGGDWVKLFSGFRVWRFLFAYMIIEAGHNKGGK